LVEGFNARTPLKIEQAFADNDYTSFIEYCKKNKLSYVSDIEMIDFVMFKSSFEATSEQVIAAKTRWKNIVSTFKDEFRAIADTNDFMNKVPLNNLDTNEERVNKNIEQETQDGLKDKSKIQDEVKNNIIEIKTISIERNGFQVKPRHSNSLRNVLGDEMYEYCTANPRKAYAFGRVFKYSLAQFNRGNNIESEFESKLLEAADIIGEEMMLSGLANPQVFSNTIFLLSPLAHKYDKTQKNKMEFQALYQHIPEENRKARLCGLCESLLYEESNIYKISKENNAEFVSDLRKLDIADWDLKNINELFELLKVLSKDLISDISISIFNMLTKSRRRDVIFSRAAGHTLEKIGKDIGVTRERIRQIESKVQNEFDSHNNRKKYLSLLSAFSPKRDIVYIRQIKDSFGELAEAFIYLLIKSESEYYIYSSDLDAFIVSDFNWYYEIEKQMDDLPDVMHENELKEQIKGITSTLNIEYYCDEVISLAKRKYNVSGQYYNQSPSSLSKIYKIVMEKCYPNGIRLYDEADLSRFRKHITDMFGDIKLPENNRAIDARVADIGILCDRGTYTLPQFVNIDETLVKDIIDYVKNSSRNSFLLVELFALFKERLLSNSNVNNHYFLQGVLKYYCKGEFYFTRDLISKNKNQISFLAELELFVEKTGTVTNYEIRKEFKGITEAMLFINIMKSRDVVIVDNGSYIHSSLINITDEDYEILRNIIDENIQGMPVSSRKLLELLYVAHPDFLNRNNIFNHLKLSGILRYMFWDDYQFSLPFIAKADSREEMSTISIIRDYLNSCDEFSIRDLSEYCKDNHLRFLSYASLLRKLSNEYLRTDSDLCVSIERLILNEDNIGAIEKNVADLARQKGYISLKNVKDFMFFPDVGIKWTGFLLESIVNIFLDSFHIIEILTSNSYILSGIIVNSEFNINNHEEFIRYTVKSEHNSMPFRNIDEIEAWLKDEGLINNVLPKALRDQGLITIDEYGKVVIN